MHPAPDRSFSRTMSDSDSPHVNPAKCLIKTTKEKGRGVYGLSLFFFFKQKTAYEIAIAQHPAEIGYYGVVTAYAHLTGQSVPPLIGTGFTVIDKSNIDDPKVKKFIYSD